MVAYYKIIKHIYIKYTKEDTHAKMNNKFFIHFMGQLL